MSRVLITGAAGFLGSNLARYFLNQNYQVIGVDNYLTGSRDNIVDLELDKDFSFVFHDVTSPLYLDEGLDGVLHLASPASPVDYLKHPIETLQVGSIGTQNMLIIAEAKACRFLLASTSEVYGDSKVNPQSENYWGNVNPVGPRSVYDEAKRYAEALTTAHNRTLGVEVRIARIFNTYGPRMRIRDGRVVSNFIVQALRGEPLTVYGDGTQTRSFCYVDDEVDGLFRLFQSELTGPINIGNPSEVHVVALAELIIKMTNSESRLHFVELPEDDPQVRNPDISLAESLLGWTPKTSLEEGLVKTIEFFRGTLRDSRLDPQGD